MLSESIGGVELNADNTFDEAKALRLAFDLRQDGIYAQYRSLFVALQMLISFKSLSSNTEHIKLLARGKVHRVAVED